MKTKSPVFGSLLGVALVLSAASAVFAGEVELSNESEGRYSATMPQEGEHTITVPADAKIVQIGTNNGWVTNSFVTLTAPEGKILQVIEGNYGSLSTEYYNGFSGQDSLFVYNGANASAPEIFKAARGTALGTLSTTGPDLTIHYKEVEQKNSWYSSFRLDLIVFVVDPNVDHNIVVDEYAASNGSVTVQSSATANTLVQVEAVPNEGYVLEGFVVRTTDEWYSIPTTENALFAGNEASFIMPGTNVTVEPVFVSTAALQSGLTLNTPSGRTLRVNIPSGVQSFKISGGGMDNELTKPMILKAPDGYLFYLEDGSAQYENRTGIFAYDGDNEDAYRTVMEPMKGKFSVGSELTLVYVSIGDQYERTIRLIEANATHGVEVYYSGNGYVEDGLSSASTGNTINLTATPDEGYMIGDIYAETYYESDWWPVRITGGTWYTGNDYSFTMPYADVEVHVEFVEKVTTADEGLYIAMPQRDSVLANIPADVESFDVLGECDWETCRGTLVLVAPEGAKFQLSGSVEFDGENASMTMFDGSIANALNQQELTQNDNIELNSSGDTLTLRYQSRDSYVSMNLRVTMFNPNRKYLVTIYDKIEDGSVLADLYEALAGDTVTLTATPDDGFLLNGFYVYYGVQQEIPYIGGRWYNNTAKFVMPAANVEVVADFAEPDEENTEFLTFIPVTDTLRLDIPSGMPFLEVRTEELGDNWEYLNNSDGVLELTAPEGYVIGMRGHIYAADNGDVLTIYNGVGENAEQSFEISNGNIDEMYSTGNSVTIHFKSNASGTDEGLRLNVAILKRAEMAAVTVVEFADGNNFVTIDGSYSGNDAVNIPWDTTVYSVNFNREFNVGAYSTLVLPFDFDARYIVGLAEVAVFNGVYKDAEDNKNKVDMHLIWCSDKNDEDCNYNNAESYALKAYTPYLIKTSQSYLTFGSFSCDPSNPSSCGIATLKQTPENASTTIGNWQFRGTLARMEWLDGDSRVYGFAGQTKDGITAGEFVRAGVNMRIGALRAYLTYVSPSKARAYGASLSNEETEFPAQMEVVITRGKTQHEQTTVIGRINTRTGEFMPAGTYDLKGRKLNGTPKAKGMYIKRK